MLKIISFFKRFAKWIGYGIALILLVICIIIGCVNTKHTKQIKEYRNTLKELNLQVDSLNKVCCDLGSMDAIRVDVRFEMKNTNVLGVTNIKAEQVAHTVAVYTRKEVLDSIRTLQ